MAALNFPTSPTTGDTYTANNKTWQWNGTSWLSVNTLLTEDAYTSASSITPDMGTYGIITVSALAEGLTINNPTGNPVDGKKLVIRIKDNGTPRSISFGTQYRASTDLTLPTTTVTSKTLYMGFIWNATDTKIDLIALLDNF